MPKTGTLRALFAGFEKQEDQPATVREAAELVKRLVDLKTLLYRWGPGAEPLSFGGGFHKTWQGIIQDGAQLSFSTQPEEARLIFRSGRWRKVVDMTAKPNSAMYDAITYLFNEVQQHEATRMGGAAMSDLNTSIMCLTNLTLKGQDMVLAPKKDGQFQRAMMTWTRHGDVLTGYFNNTDYHCEETQTAMMESLPDGRMSLTYERYLDGTLVQCGEFGRDGTGVPSQDSKVQEKLQAFWPVVAKVAKPHRQAPTVS